VLNSMISIASQQDWAFIKSKCKGIQADLANVRDRLYLLRYCDFGMEISASLNRMCDLATNAHNILLLQSYDAGHAEHNADVPPISMRLLLEAEVLIAQLQQYKDRHFDLRISVVKRAISSDNGCAKTINIQCLLQHSKQIMNASSNRF